MEENINSKPTNVAYIHAKSNSLTPLENDKIELRKIIKEELKDMVYETYDKSDLEIRLNQLETKTDQRINQLDNKIEQRFERIEEKFNNYYTKSEMDLKFEMVDRKIDSTADKIISKTEKMFADLKTDMTKAKLAEIEQSHRDKREIILWSIGTAIAILAIVVPLLLQKK